METKPDVSLEWMTGGWGYIAEEAAAEPCCAVHYCCPGKKVVPLKIWRATPRVAGATTLKFTKEAQRCWISVQIGQDR